MAINWSKIIERAAAPTEGINIFVGENADIWVIPNAAFVDLSGRAEVRKIYEADFWNDIEGFLIDNSYCRIYRCGTLENLPIEPERTLEAYRFFPKAGDVVIDTEECIIYVVVQSVNPL